MGILEGVVLVDVVKTLHGRKEYILKRCRRRRLRAARVVKSTGHGRKFIQGRERLEIRNPGYGRRKIELGNTMVKRGNDESLAGRQDGIEQIGKEKLYQPNLQE